MSTKATEKLKTQIESKVMISSLMGSELDLKNYEVKIEDIDAEAV